MLWAVRMPLKVRPVLFGCCLLVTEANQNCGSKLSVRDQVDGPEGVGMGGNQTQAYGLFCRLQQL